MRRRSSWRLLGLFHPLPSVLTTLAAVACALIFGLRPDDARLWVIAVTMLLVQTSISALNEYADAELDKSAGRERPIPLGLLDRRTAGILAGVLGGAALLLSTLALGPVPTGLVLLGLACGWLYDLVLKPTPLSFLPFAIAFPLLPVWVGLIAHRPSSSFIPIILAGVPLAIGIHLADAIPDRDSDRTVGVVNLAVVLGRPVGELAAAALVSSVLLDHALIKRYGYGFGGDVLVLALLYLAFSFSPLRSSEPWRLMLPKWILIGDAFAAGISVIALA